MSLSPIEQKFRRNLDPVMQRAMICGEALRAFPYEEIDAMEYARLGRLVREIERFLGHNGENKKENISALANHQAV